MNLQTDQQITWCPGCGNHSIFGALKNAIEKSGLKQHEIVFTYGIGCHGHMVNYLDTYGFEGLHGRPIPLAEGIKLANPRLTVFVVAGDGDTFGEGLNHFIQACRRNININMFIHDNRVYGLTTGQTSPTSDKGYMSKSTPTGVIEEPVNGPALALTSSATFVAQELSSDVPNLIAAMEAAVSHQGISYLNILQNCQTFNKINTIDWFQKNSERVETNDHSSLRQDVLASVIKPKKLPLGVLYQAITPTYTDQIVKEKKLVEFDDLQRYFM